MDVGLGKYQYICNNREIPHATFGNALCNFRYFKYTINTYISGRDYYEPDFTDELITQRDELLATEPYKTINENGIDSVAYENNIATIEVEDSEETYQFQIEFTETGDKISKITYIDPMASMSEEEKQEYMVEHEVIPAYEKYVSENPISTSQEPYSFIFMNDDTIPELVIQGDSEATGNMICTYIDNKVVSMYTGRLSFSFLEKQNLLNNSDGNMGYYYDKIFSIKNGTFECVYSGETMEAHDDEGRYITDENGNILYEYLWNGQQVSSDEYKNSLAQVYDGNQAIGNYDLSYYSSIQEAYDNMGDSPAVATSEESVSEVYYDMMYACDVFELNNQRLQIEAEEFSIDLEISSDCVWQSRYTDGSVYDSSYDELQRIWKSELDSKQSAEEMGIEYESPSGLGVEVKDGKVIAVYMTAS